MATLDPNPFLMILRKVPLFGDISRDNMKVNILSICGECMLGLVAILAIIDSNGRDDIFVQGLENEYVMASTSKLDSKNSAPLSIQKSKKSKEATKTPKKGHSPGMMQDRNLHSSYTPHFSKQGTSQVSSSPFSSLPSMHMGVESNMWGSLGSNPMDCILDGPIEPQFIPLLESAKSWPETRFHDAWVGSTPSNESLLSQMSKDSPDLMQRKYFMPHWSVEAINEALEKGYAFRASFRVNVHNRLEGYCTLEGVPTDVLITGPSAQNRAEPYGVIGDNEFLMVYQNSKGNDQLEYYN
eukprot:Gb_36973 [translate_table: standard]